MNKIDEAKQILQYLGLPDAQQNDTSALTLLALCDIKEKDNWKEAQRKSLGVSKGIMEFMKKNYKRTYAPNTRETVRRQVLHQFVQARIADYNPDYPDLPVNSPRAHYAISIDALNVIKNFGTKKWNLELKKFLNKIDELKKVYRKRREAVMVPVKFKDRSLLKLSPGKHNEIQAAIVELFAPRFATNSIILYFGDTENKDLYIDNETLEKIGIPIDQHSKLPDIVLYDKEKQWIFLIEAVTSHGPVSPKRVYELEDLLKHCNAGKIYITAFYDFKEFKKHSQDIAWETEVWLLEFPDHLIHYNGDMFFGPRKT
ncbi:MAG: restriction endonuclease [Ignavibacteria bacterium GWB2_35_12]|nr:MAG: restriction endonuclease [Ignavibacteria bacterium GWA2_35_8]OGU39173.1 MAG: restriction endonuclease [Ignavibacteria bacterium GWB2_35_12]OGU89201.1 MAG: restriction endonuclease [Ignavibacteria bacterium RIFOXYA2_FULL_35_10]OGV21039.1 MAG: restriction endonuclease [Ignavibacteria bacterium RIFOXYC2_FULL_35_21]